jgi:hypothetical protein
MKIHKVRRFGLSLQIAICLVFSCAVGTSAQEATEVASVLEGSSAALEFEKSFRDLENAKKSRPIQLQQCENITELTKELWSKEHVLADFRKNRTQDQVGVIVFLKTEYCCKGSRLCAVTTACMEKKSTPLVGRFRVYAGWIKNNLDHPAEEWGQWDKDVIKEYRFVQGPGARIFVMLPLEDGEIHESLSNATKLGFGKTTFEKHEGETPKLERWLQDALKHLPTTMPPNPALPEDS